MPTHWNASPAATSLHPMTRAAGTRCRTLASACAAGSSPRIRWGRSVRSAHRTSPCRDLARDPPGAAWAPAATSANAAGPDCYFIVMAAPGHFGRASREQYRRQEDRAITGRVHKVPVQADYDVFMDDRYDTRLDNKYGSLTMIDIPAEVAAHQPWFNQT